MATAQDKLQNLARNYALAWSSGNPDYVASFFAPGGQITIYRGAPLVGQAAVAEVAKGFFTEFPDLDMTCDTMRKAGDHALFAWTLQGTHAETGNQVTIRGWEEWEMDAELRIRSAHVWFDPDDHQRQIEGR
ncbi:SgcJ/EcaC family oxidoreductase [Ruegeria jejuensis]|uniref:SgcJ/EcaC family oxidoreductase n=1 Tax=Ruegeria jejuensis TaxID=3233338 RepID=UPI00355BD39E